MPNKCKTPTTYHHFEIVGQAANETSLLILESINKKKVVPSLNNQSSSAPLHTLLKKLYCVTVEFPPSLSNSI